MSSPAEAPPVPGFVFSCPHCGRPLDGERVQTGLCSCVHCQGFFEAIRLSPIQRPIRVMQVAQAGPEGATACANHEHNVSTGNCGRCGVFMCNLCKIESDGMVLCPACFDRLTADGTLPGGRNKIRDYAGITSGLTILSFLFWPIAIVSGPAAIFYGFRGLRKKKESDENDGRFGIWCSMILAAAVTTGAIFLFGLIFAGFSKAIK